MMQKSHQDTVLFLYYNIMFVVLMMMCLGNSRISSQSLYTKGQPVKLYRFL